MQTKDSYQVYIIKQTEYIFQESCNLTTNYQGFDPSGFADEEMAATFIEGLDTPGNYVILRVFKKG